MRGEAICPQPKAKPHLLVQRKAKATVKEIDDKEKAKCRERSGGRCEVREKVRAFFVRCDRNASENHHLIGGIGRRNRGESILAKHRLHVCLGCHREITGKVLVPAVEQSKAECAATVKYRRVE